ncbi:hypothetical protein [Tateyamaria sp.]|uniref:hypothetical protein n=1 Tax=Tateyamaria sp. TaxID=1929288 RepID=UPI0032A0A9D8
MTKTFEELTAELHASAKEQNKRHTARKESVRERAKEMIAQGADPVVAFKLAADTP